MKKTLFLAMGIVLCQQALSQQCGLSFLTYDECNKNSSNQPFVRFTSNTENNDLDRFEIERSRDNNATFQVIGVIPATKNTTGNTTYNFTDVCAPAPISPATRVYYRIKWYSTSNQACSTVVVGLLPPFSSCSNACTASVLLVPDNKVCSGSSAAFEVTNSPGIVSWSLSPNNASVATLTPFSGTRVLVNKVGDGFVTLNASVSGNGCSKNFSQPLIIGTAPIENNGISTCTINSVMHPLGTGNGGPISAGSTASIQVNVNNLLTVGNVTWTINNPGSPAITGFGQTANGHQAWFNINLPSGAWSNGATLDYSAQTGCGTSEGTIGFSVYKQFFFTIMQDDGIDAVMIKTHGSDPRSAAAEGTPPKIYAARVIDLNGIIRKNYSYAGGIVNTTLYLEGLRPGIYIVSVFDGSAWNNKKIFLK